MYINSPDPHPGRCQNLRPSTVKPGTFLRCLDYEGLKHVCSFEKETPPNFAHSVVGGNIYTPAQPKPWVKPKQEQPYIKPERSDGGW